MKNGAILANAGHFNVELDLSALRSLAASARGVRPGLDEYTLEDGRRIHLLADGRVVNLTVAEGQPAAVLDVGFASHALAAEHVVARGHELDRHVYGLPAEIDREVARLELLTHGIAIDTLTEAQGRYLSSWDQS
jgi:adenosylhomocysteinase